MMTLIGLLALVFFAGLLLLTLATVALWVGDQLRLFVRAALLDLVQFYSAWSMAQLDVTERSAKLEAAIDTAAAELHHRIQVDRLEVNGLTLKLGAEAHKLRLLQRESEAAR